MISYQFKKRVHVLSLFGLNIENAQSHSIAEYKTLFRFDIIFRAVFACKKRFFADDPFPESVSLLPYHNRLAALLAVVGIKCPVHVGYVSHRHGFAYQGLQIFLNILIGTVKIYGIDEIPDTAPSLDRKSVV